MKILYFINLMFTLCIISRRHKKSIFFQFLYIAIVIISFCIYLNTKIGAVKKVPIHSLLYHQFYYLLLLKFLNTLFPLDLLFLLDISYIHL